MSRARRHVISVSLFPFLAVLICIMGALVIILVLMVARVGDTDLAAAADSSSPDDDRRIREQLEDAQWKRDLLEKSRTEKSQELADKRAELSHLEEHIQRLNQQAKELLDLAKTIDEGRQLRAEDLEKARQELIRLQAESADKKKKLIEKAKQRSTEKPSYALIPYDGPNGTRRRPIYIECDELGITIQPEGIVFMADDFQGPLGPGNPLDAALRTIRERLAQGGGKAGEPYPLLIVRPNGIHAYSSARTALKSWDDEFGYELIGDDKRLDYGQADPVTTAALEKTVKTARQRQALLASAMPRKFAGGDGLTSFAGEPSGGGGGGGFGSGSSGGYGGNFGSGGYGGGSGGYRGGSTTGSFGTPGGGGAGSSPGFAGGSSATGSAGVSSRTSGAGNGGTGGPGTGGLGGAGTGGTGTGSPGGAVTGSGGSGASGSPGDGPTGSGSSGSSANGASGRPSGSSSAAGVSVPTFGYTPGQGGSGNSTGSSSSSATGQPGGTNQSGGSNQSGNSFAGQKGGKAGDSNSKSRLPNWAVPNARVNSIGVTRPIHVAVLPDRLVIVPEQGDDRHPQQFPISPNLTPQEVDAFVGAVQKEMKSWGLAVQNGFWRPQLIMDVSPQAEQQCRELQTALEGSGFDLQRKFR